MYAFTETPEPHAVRRRAILAEHPEIRERNGYDSWSIPVMIFAVLAQLGLAVAVETLFDPSQLALSIAATIGLILVAGAVLSHWSSMFTHEAAHNNTARTPELNKMWAMVANISQVLPNAMTFRKYHLRHHGHLGTYGVDADLPADWEVENLPANPVMKGFWVFFMFGFWVARGAERATSPNRDEWVNLGVIVVANALIVYTIGWYALGYLLLSTLIGHSFHPVAAHFIHEHYVFEPEQETNSYYGLLNLVTYNVGYHVEHHDFPNIPGSQLPKYKADYPQYYDGLVSHHSWTCILTRFIFNPAMGWTSRIARSDRRGGQWQHAEHTPNPGLLIGFR